LRALLALIATALACASCGASLAPPALPDPAGLDPAVAELLERRLADVRARPDAAEAHGALGLALEANDLWLEAERSFANAAQLAPSEPPWRYHRALALGALGEAAAALELLRAVARELPEAPYAAQRLGEAALAAEALDEARAAFERTTRLAPERSEGFAGLGASELAAGRTREALSALERAVALDPSYKNAHYRLGLAYREAGRTAEAERELALGVQGRVRYLPDPYAEQLRKDAVASTARFVHAMTLLESGRPERAAKVLESLRAAQPEDVTVLNNLAIALQRAGQLEAARARLEEAAALAPEVLSTWINLSALALEQNTTARALECAERALTLEPDSAKAHLARGRVLLRQGRGADAREEFERARRADPRELEALALLAESCLADERLDEAASLYAELCKERPLDAEAHLGLARLALRRGERTAAERELALARRIAPDHPGLADLAAELGSR